MQMTSSCMFLAYYDAKSMPMHHNSICLARGVLLEHPCHATDPFWHNSMPLVMLVMTCQPYFFEKAVSSSPTRPYLRQKYVRRIITVSRIVLLWSKAIEYTDTTCLLAVNCTPPVLAFAKKGSRPLNNSSKLLIY